MAELTITDVRTVLTQPGRHRLLVVRVVTSETGLEGLGCATFHQRPMAVKATVDHHLRPLVLGRDPRRTQDLWRVMTGGGYWRHGPVLNCAASGIDMALWDIKGKLAGMPCYELWGGLARPAATVYVHCDAPTPEALADQVRRRLADGVTHCRCQMGGYAGVEAREVAPPPGAAAGAYFDPKEKLRRVPALFAYLREELGDDVELLYDVHERLDPPDAVLLAKQLEPYRLFFLEDPVAPEDLAALGRLRSQCATPIAMGELFSHPAEAHAAVTRGLIDFLRVHLAQVGGITPALKLAHLAEACGVRTAWHGPPDQSPVGAAAMVHLDVALANFGIQEWCDADDATREVFPGALAREGGAVAPSEGPGLGVELDEAAAARHPASKADPTWTETRRPDGGHTWP